MIEDKLLIWKFRRGSTEALRRIYEKYEGYLLTLATALLNDVHAAEDVVHDCFVSLAQSADKLRVDGRLKGYLAVCVANCARDKIRSRRRRLAALHKADLTHSNATGPELSAVCNEELQQLSRAIVQLPYEQREVIMLRLQGGMKFRQIAELQNLSVNTVRSRYRYGMCRLQSLLSGMVAE